MLDEVRNMKTLPKSLPKLLWYFIKNQKVGFLLLLPSAFGWGLQSSLYALFVQLIIDKASQYNTQRMEVFQGVAFTITLLIGLWFLIDCGFRLYDFVSARVFPKFQSQIRMSLFEYTLGHSHRYFSDHFAGTIASRISRMPESMTQIIVLYVTIFIPITIAFCVNSFIVPVHLPPPPLTIKLMTLFL